MTGIEKLNQAINGLDSELTIGMIHNIFEALNKFDPREKKIIFLRFGLENNNQLSFKEIGKEIENKKSGETGIKGERVRQIEKRVLKKLKHPSRGLRVG